MRVRVTIERTFTEYTDIYVQNVESVFAGVEQVKRQLTESPASRARLLNKQTWMRGEQKGPSKIIESGSADQPGI